MPNNFSRLDSAQAVNASRAVTNVVDEAPNPYGFPILQLNALKADTTLLIAAVAAQYNAEQAAKAATQAKNEALATVARELSALAKTADANPAVTNGMLLAIGFAPRSSGGSKPQVLFPPTGLVAEALPSGQAKIRWSRCAATKANTVFTLWSSADGVNFSILAAGTKASCLVEDAPAGVPAWYRVTASRGNVVSAPSAPVSIYAPSVAGAPVQLRVA